MDDEADDISFEELKRYLEENVVYHLRESTPFHSWPCAVWQQRSESTWEALRNHGMIPKNVLLILDDPEDVV